MVAATSKILLLVLLFAPTVSGGVVRIEVNARQDLVAGPFGLVGRYEKLIGRIYFAIDPGNSANRIIADIDYAPRNSSGQVEFHSDYFLIKPKQVDRGNGTILYEVSNRGRKSMLSFFN